MLFSLKTHRELFEARDGRHDEATWPVSLLATLAGQLSVALVSEIFVESVQMAAEYSMTLRRWFRRRGAGGGADGLGLSLRKNRLTERGYRTRCSPRSPCRCPGSRAVELRHRPHSDGPAPLAGSGGDGARRHPDCDTRHERPIGLVRRRAGPDALPDIRDDVVPDATTRLGDENSCLTQTRRHDYPASKAFFLKALNPR